MKILPQTWQSFKFTIGLAVITSAIFYGVLVTILVLLFGEKCSGNSLVWNFLNTIISTTLGWYLAKASTVIDYVWGASVKQPNVPPPTKNGGVPYAGEPYTPSGSGPNITPTSGGVRRAADLDGYTVTTRQQGFNPENPSNEQAGLRHDPEDPRSLRQPGEAPWNRKDEGDNPGNPVHEAPQPGGPSGVG